MTRPYARINDLRWLDHSYVRQTVWRVSVAILIMSLIGLVL